MMSQLVQSKDYSTLSLTASVSCLYRKRWLHRTHHFCRQFDNNFDKLWGGYKTFRPRLTKYCRGCVPGGVDAYAMAVDARYWQEDRQRDENCRHGHADI